MLNVDFDAITQKLVVHDTKSSRKYWRRDDVYRYTCRARKHSDDAGISIESLCVVYVLSRACSYVFFSIGMLARYILAVENWAKDNIDRWEESLVLVGFTKDQISRSIYGIRSQYFAELGKARRAWVWCAWCAWVWCAWCFSELPYSCIPVLVN